MQIREILDIGVSRLEKCGIESPKTDARILLGHVLGKSREWLLIHDNENITDEEFSIYNEMIAKREIGNPVAYIIGSRDFWSLTLKCSSVTLIPQPDTEVLVEQALLHAKSGSLLDLGTGTGAIALAIKKELPELSVVATDLVPEAIKLAIENAELNGLEIEFREGRWFEPILDGEKFNIIVSNPPYIDGEDPHLCQGDVRFEPKTALVSDNHGTADLFEIIRNSGKYLINGGWLLLEHGYNQGFVVREAFKSCGYQLIETVRDYGGNERVTKGVWNG